MIIPSKKTAVKMMVCPAHRSFITIAEISTPDPNVIHAPKCPIRCFLKRPYCTCEMFSSKVVYKSEITMVNALLLWFTCTLLRCRGECNIKSDTFFFFDFMRFAVRTPPCGQSSREAEDNTASSTYGRRVW